MRHRPEGKLFTNRRGEPWSRQSVYERMQEIQKQTGLENLVGCAVRHAWITEVLSRGLSSTLVAQLAGTSERTVVPVAEAGDRISHAGGIRVVLEPVRLIDQIESLVGGDDGEVRVGGRADQLLDESSAIEGVGDALRQLVGAGGGHGGQVALAVAIEDQDLVVHLGEGGTQVYGGGCLADTALVVDDGDPHQGLAVAVDRAPRRRGRMPVARGGARCGFLPRLERQHPCRGKLVELCG
ncbi:MAG TPA: hypothetical protein VG013_30855 [Gemmataceae bacterium]|nr:hypothetical protein [Gemmataceae bacterium]